MTNQATDWLFFEGGKRAIILFHTYSGTPNDVRLLGRRLNNAGYSVLLPIFSGHGTEHPEDILAAGVLRWKEDSEKAIAFLKDKGYLNIATFGLSMGGVYSFYLLENHPEIVLGGGSMCAPLGYRVEPNIEPVFMHYSEKLLKKQALSSTEMQTRLTTIHHSLKQQLVQISDFMDDVYERLVEVYQPTILVQGGQDTMIDPQTVYQIEQKLTKSHPLVKWYENSGHVITIGPDKNALQEDVETFLEQLPWDK